MQGVRHVAAWTMIEMMKMADFYQPSDRPISGIHALKTQIVRRKKEREMMGRTALRDEIFKRIGQLNE